MKNLMLELFRKLQNDEVTRFAASLSYYMALSFAPILILFVVVSSGLSPHLKDDLELQIASLVGEHSGELVHNVLQSSQARPDLTSIAGLAGVLTLLFSASLIFGELRAAMNRIFECAPQVEESQSTLETIYLFLKERLLHVGMVLSFTLIITVSLVASSLLYGFKFEDRWLAVTANILTSLGFYTVAFALMIRYIPDDRQAWKTSFKAGITIGLMFLVGKELISVYLGTSAVGSAYGAVGSIVVLLVWVYYSAMIILVGTETSRVFLSKPSLERPRCSPRPSKTS